MSQREITGEHGRSREVTGGHARAREIGAEARGPARVLGQAERSELVEERAELATRPHRQRRELRRPAGQRRAQLRSGGGVVAGGGERIARLPKQKESEGIGRESEGVRMFNGRHKGEYIMLHPYCIILHHMHQKESEGLRQDQRDSSRASSRRRHALNAAGSGSESSPATR